MDRQYIGQKKKDQKDKSKTERLQCQKQRGHEKPYTDRTKSSLCFIPSSDFIIGDNCNRGQYFTADTI